MNGPTMRQLRSWHRRLSNAHDKATDVGSEAEAALGYDEASVIMDPAVELHAALSVVEGLIAQRRESLKRKDTQHDPRP